MPRKSLSEISGQGDLWTAGIPNNFSVFVHHKSWNLKGLMLMLTGRYQDPVVVKDDTFANQQKYAMASSSGVI